MSAEAKKLKRRRPSPPKHDYAPGMRLTAGAGHDIWSLATIAGAGGMGVVVGLRDLRIGGAVTGMKIMLPALVDSRGALDRFTNEARIGKLLSEPPRGADGRKRRPCPNIVRVDRFGRLDDGNYFFTMEWVEGKALSWHLARGLGGPVVIPPDEALPLAMSVLDGLVYANYRGVIHRDIKPQNILLTDDDERAGERIAKLIDFGVAILKAEPRPTFAGTLSYAAPEQIAARDLDGKADVYALYAILFEMLTGRLPWPVVRHTDNLVQDLLDTLETRRHARNLADHGTFPKALADLMRRGLAFDRAERPDAAESIELLDAIRREHFADPRDPHRALTIEAPGEGEKAEIEPNDIDLTVPAQPPAARLLGYDEGDEEAPAAPSSQDPRPLEDSGPRASSRPRAQAQARPMEVAEAIDGRAETSPLTPMPTRMPVGPSLASSAPGAEISSIAYIGGPPPPVPAPLAREGERQALAPIVGSPIFFAHPQVPAPEPPPPTGPAQGSAPILVRGAQTLPDRAKLDEAIARERARQAAIASAAQHAADEEREGAARRALAERIAEADRDAIAALEGTPQALPIEARIAAADRDAMQALQQLEAREKAHKIREALRARVDADLARLPPAEEDERRRGPRPNTSLAPRPIAKPSILVTVPMHPAVRLADEPRARPAPETAPPAEAPSQGLRASADKPSRWPFARSPREIGFILKVGLPLGMLFALVVALLVLLWERFSSHSHLLGK